MSTETVLAIVVAFVLGGVATLVGQWIQHRAAIESEQSRFRHEMASLTAKVRLERHMELLDRVGECYRLKVNRQEGSSATLDGLKNFYYANVVFFWGEVGYAFRHLRRSLEASPFNRDVLEANLAQLYNAVAEELLLTELHESARRAVRHHEGWIRRTASRAVAPIRAIWRWALRIEPAD